MPGISGAVLAASLATVCPGIQPFFMSGYTVEEMASMGLKVCKEDCISKPFGQDSVDRVLRILSARRQAAVS
jgi:FixJ family two-component response regulator